MKDKILMEISKLLDEYANSQITPEVDAGPMNQDDFVSFIDKWDLSSGFLQKILNKSKDTIANYKFRGKPIPAAVAIRIRKLDLFFTRFSGEE